MNPLLLILGASAGLFVVFVIVTAVVLNARGSSQSDETGSSLFGSNGAVGVIELKGVIMKSAKILERMEEFEENDRVKAVVLRLDSPGGSVAPSQEIYRAVRDYEKPIVVSMASVAASGAFYIAMGADRILANPGTITGSIGVIMMFMNLSRLYEWAKVERFTIKTGKYKDSGADHRQMRPDEKKLFQGMIDQVLAQFKKAIAEGRKLKMNQVTPIADGRIFSGEQALKYKVIDELGGIQEAIDAAAKLAEIDGEPKVIYPRKPKRGLMERMLDPRPENEMGGIGGLLARLIGNLGGGRRTSADGPMSWVDAEWTPGIYWLWNGR
jgi:protease-4